MLLPETPCSVARTETKGRFSTAAWRFRWLHGRGNGGTVATCPATPHLLVCGCKRMGRASGVAPLLSVCMGNSLCLLCKSSGTLLTALPLRHAVPRCRYGTGASSEGWAFMRDGLVGHGYRVIGIDFPGFGRTGGDRLPSRSEFNCAAGGPVDIVLTVLDHFGIRKATVLGYDWGGGIAWSLAAASPKRVSCIVAFHSTYTADKKRPELQAVRCKNLVLWAPPDSFHPLAWGKAFVKLLRRAELQVRTIIVRWCLAAERCFDNFLSGVCMCVCDTV